jgi:hypothetical protein
VAGKTGCAGKVQLKYNRELERCYGRCRTVGVGTESEI